jgi:hypothetical protein
VNSFCLADDVRAKADFIQIPGRSIEFALMHRSLFRLRIAVASNFMERMGGHLPSSKEIRELAAATVVARSLEAGATIENSVPKPSLSEVSHIVRILSIPRIATTLDLSGSLAPT